MLSGSEYGRQVQKVVESGEEGCNITVGIWSYGTGMWSYQDRRKWPYQMQDRNVVIKELKKIASGQKNSCIQGRNEASETNEVVSGPKRSRIANY